MNSTRRILSAAVLLVLLTFGRAARAVEFRFTVTADPRIQHSRFANTLQAINGLIGGPGAFHVSPGDVDQSIPDNRLVIDQAFGADALWYPGVGNHEAETGADMVWLRNEYNNGNYQRTPLKESTNQDGPPSSLETNYTWDYGNAHFVQLNQYWNGFSDTGTNGDIVPALYDWLAADLAANTKPAVFVFGHEPAFPYNRHVGDSLDQHRANRDRFWQLLEDYDVAAFFCGHTHVYSTHQGDVNHNGEVWQVDVGNAGNGSPQTFVNVIVGDSDVTFETYNNSMGWRLYETWTQPIPDLSTSLTWDEKGPGNWGQEQRWIGDTAPFVPDDMTHVEVKTDTVEVAEDGWALTLTVGSGGVAIGFPAVLTVSEDVVVGAGAALDVAGTLNAQSLTTFGTTIIAGGGVVSVGQSLDVGPGARLEVAGRLNAQSLSTFGTNVIGSGAIVSVTEGVDVAPSATLDLAGAVDAQWLTTAGTNIVADGASLSVGSGLTVESPLDLSGATLGTIPQVTNVHVNSGGVLTVGHPLAAAELNVAGIVQAAGAELTALNVTGGGLLSSSADVTAEDVSVTGGAIDLIGGANLNVATMQVSGGVVNTGTGHVVVGRHLKIGNKTTIDITGATFKVSSLNLADPAEPDNLTLSGGSLVIPGGIVAPRGAIALWKFQEQTGPTAADLSAAGNKHLGTLSVPEWFSDDPDHSTALKFVDGNSVEGNYVEIAETDDIHLGSPFTIAMWIKTSEKGRTLLGNGKGDPVTQRYEKDLYIDAAGGQLALVSKSFLSFSKMEGNRNVANDEWHHVAVTYNGSQADQEIYVDGENDTGIRGYGTSQDGGPVVRLGYAETIYGDAGYVGLMDEVYLYDRSLSAAEVADLYESFGKVMEPLPNTNLRVTAKSNLYLDTASAEATLGNLTLDPGVALEVTGATAGFNHVTAGDGSSIKGALSVGGTLSVGDSAGRFDVDGGLTMQGGSIYEWELGTGTPDLEVDGDLVLMDGWTLRLGDAGGTCVASQQFDLFTYTGLLTFDQYQIDSREVEGSGRWIWSEAEILRDGNRVYLTGLTVVPEPGTMVLATVALLGFLAYAWRKRRPAARMLRE